MDSIGLRELRQHASDIVKRAEAGEELLITVAGRPAAVLGPANPRRWRRYQEVRAIFELPDDPEWEADRARLDQTVANPWR